MQKELFKNQEMRNLAAESFPKISEVPVSWGEINLKRADQYKAIVNPDTGKVFSIVTKDYKLIRHEDAIQQIESAINDNLELSNYKTTIGFYNDGARMRAIFRFYKKSFVIQMDDAVSPELHLYNSYDTTWPLIVLIGAFRYVCTNGLVVGEKYLHLRKRHVYHFDDMDFKEQVATSLKRFKLQTNQWKRWTDRQLTEITYEKSIKTMKFGRKAKELIEKRMDHESKDYTDNGFPIMNLWIFYNVLTWYITHQAASLNHRVEMERRLRFAIRNWK